MGDQPEYDDVAADATGDLERELAASADWIRRLAFRLIADRHLAEDVSQEVLAVALEDPPPFTATAANRSRLFGWLRTVTRRSALRSLRREKNRREREALVARDALHDACRGAFSARPAGVPATGDGAEVEATVRRAVLDLGEPYRSVLLLRFYEGCDAAEIARRRGSSPATVRKQLSRGLGRVAERLPDRWSPKHGAQLGSFRVAARRLLPWIGGLAAAGLVAALVWQAGAPSLVASGSDALPAPRGELEAVSSSPDPLRLRVRSAEGALVRGARVARLDGREWSWVGVTDALGEVVLPRLGEDVRLGLARPDRPFHEFAPASLSGEHEVRLPGRPFVAVIILEGRPAEDGLEVRLRVDAPVDRSEAGRPPWPLEEMGFLSPDGSSVELRARTRDDGLVFFPDVGADEEVELLWPESLVLVSHTFGVPLAGGVGIAAQVPVAPYAWLQLARREQSE